MPPDDIINRTDLEHDLQGLLDKRNLLPEARKHIRAALRELKLLRTGWKRVVFSHETDRNGNCPNCEIPYEDCGCPGPTQDEVVEYMEHAGVLYARQLEVKF